MTHTEFFREITTDNTLARFDVIFNKIVELVDNHEDASLLEFMDACIAGNPDRGVIRTVLMTVKPIRKQIAGLESKYDQLHSMLNPVHG